MKRSDINFPFLEIIHEYNRSEKHECHFLEGETLMEFKSRYCPTNQGKNALLNVKGAVQKQNCSFSRVSFLQYG